MARQNRDDPGSLEEQLAWLDAIKENEDVPTSLDTVGEDEASPYPKDPWLAVPADPAPSPPPMFRAAINAVYNPASVAVADESDAAETTKVDDPTATRPVKARGTDDASSKTSSGTAAAADWSASSGSDRSDAFPLSGGSALRTPAAGSSGDSADASADGTPAAAKGGLGDAADRGRSTLGRSSDAYGGLGAFAASGSADTEIRPGAFAGSGASRDDDTLLQPLPKPDKSDPLGLGAFGDRGRDGGAGGGSLGAFAEAEADSEGRDEPVRGWLEPAVPPPAAESDEDDDLEQKRFEAFMSGGDVRDVAPRVDRRTHKRETPPPASGSASADPLAASSDSSRRTSALDPLSGPLPSATPSTPSTSSTETDPHLRLPGASGRDTGPHATPRADTGPQSPLGMPSGTDTGPQAFPRTDSGPHAFPRTDTGPQGFPRTDSGPESFGRTDTGPQAFPGMDVGSESLGRTDSGPHAFPRTDGGSKTYGRADTGPQAFPRTDGASESFGRADTGPQPSPRTETGAKTPPRADRDPLASAFSDSGPHPTASRADAARTEPAATERRAQHARRRPIPQQAFSSPSRPATASPSKPTADSLDPQNLLKGRRNAPASGWRRLVYKASAGWIKPGEPAEVRRRRELVNRARTPVATGHHRVAVLSLKGGVGKTTTTVGLGATLAQVRGDRVIAVDANPDRGTLSDKVVLETSATVRDLLNERDQIQRYVDIRAFTSQAPSRLEILASDRDPSVSEAFSAADYQTIAQILENFYSICITDCGTGLLHSAMSGVLGMADQIVLVSSPSVDGARAASATLDWLEAHHYGDLVKAASVVLCSVRPRSKSTVDLDRLEAHFAARCREVVRVPYDPHLEEGAEIDLDRLQPATLDAYLRLAAAVGDGFAGPQY